MIRFLCPACRTLLWVADRHASAKVACSKCGQRVQAPPAPPPNKTMLGLPAPTVANPAAPPQAVPIISPASDLPVAQFNPAASDPAAEGPVGLICAILSCVFGGASVLCLHPLPLLLLSLSGAALGVIGLALGKSKNTRRIGVAGVVLSVLGVALKAALLLLLALLWSAAAH